MEFKAYSHTWKKIFDVTCIDLLTEKLSGYVDFEGNEGDVFDADFDGVDYTLIEFTELYDKNKQKIYTYDILRHTLIDGSIRLYKIWKTKGGYVMNACQDDFYKDHSQILFYESIADMQTSSFVEGSLEKIGNIFQNPEILTKPIF